MLLNICLFGPFTVTVGGQHTVTFRSKKIEALFAYLAAEPNRPHSRQALAQLLWSDYPDDVALRNLRLSLSRLRQSLSAPMIGRETAVSNTRPDLLRISEQDVQLQVDGRYCATDNFTFNTLLESVARHPHGALFNCSLCAARLELAVELYQSDFLGEFVLPDAALFEEWYINQQNRKQQQIAAALETLTQYYQKQGNYFQAQKHARNLINLNPLDERAHRLLIDTFARAGVRSAALLQYENCRQILQEQLNLDPDAETQALYNKIRHNNTLPGTTPILSHNKEPRTKPHLPADITPFLGRAVELKKLEWLLLNPANRLINVTGPGGVGKTRLVTAAALRIGHCFADNIWFVSLPQNGERPNRLSNEPSERQQIATMIARTLPLSPLGDTAKSLFDYLAPREGLLILDGFESWQAVKPFILELMEQAPRLIILLTSQISLSHWGAVDMRLEGFQNAAVFHGTTVTNDNSVALFAECANRGPATFKLTRENVSIVAEICRLLDGMPYAIEMAAMRLGEVNCQELLNEIQNAPHLLHTEMRDVPPRHRNLYAAFNYSWRQLSQRQQGLFNQLALLPQEFSLKAALKNSDLSRAELDTFVDYSLLAAGPSCSYRQYHVLRQMIILQSKPTQVDVPVAKAHGVRNWEAATHERLYY